MRINDSFQRFAALVAILSLFLDSLGNMLNVEFLTLLGLSIYILLAPIWALWIGIDLLRKPVQVHPCEREGTVSFNLPKTLSEFPVGAIYNLMARRRSSRALEG